MFFEKHASVRQEVRLTFKHNSTHRERLQLKQIVQTLVVEVCSFSNSISNIYNKHIIVVEPFSLITKYLKYAGF